MAEIQIEYRDYQCDIQCTCNTEPTMQCFTQDAEDMDCQYFRTAKERTDHCIPYGDCKHAVINKKYKGMSVKNYTMQEMTDPFEPHLNCMLLQVGKRQYDCTKVILDGKVIYNEEDG